MLHHLTTLEDHNQALFPDDLEPAERLGFGHSCSYEAEANIDYRLLVDTMDYSPETGLFHWYRLKPGLYNVSVGDEAGCRLFVKEANKAYRVLTICGGRFLAHRIAYLWVMGEPAEGVVDHIDGDSLNNRWENLRSATKGQDGCNISRQKRNTSGFKGVTRCNGRFRATIAFQRKCIHLGMFDTPEEAHEAYAKAAKEHHGEFAKIYYSNAGLHSSTQKGAL